MSYIALAYSLDADKIQEVNQIHFALANRKFFLNTIEE